MRNTLNKRHSPWRSLVIFIIGGGLAFIGLSCAPSGEEGAPSKPGTKTVGTPPSTTTPPPSTTTPPPTAPTIPAPAPAPTPTTTPTPPPPPPTTVPTVGTIMYLNPGCDPDVKASGITALVGFNRSSENQQIIRGKKWWLYDPIQKRFVKAGRDIAAHFRQFSPDCSATGTDGLHVNPGCDPDVKAFGITAAAGFHRRTGGDGTWQVIYRKKWWNFDPVSQRWSGQGKDIAAAYRNGFPPDCNVRGSDGLHVNPGCDPSVQSQGITALLGLSRTSGVDQQIILGKKWWNFSPATNSFVGGGSDIAAAYRGFQPNCSVRAADGIHMNPGCDSTVQSVGVTAIAGFNRSGPDQIITSGKKWWSFDPTQNRFVDGGQDHAAMYRQVAPDCNATLP